jgi:AmmeMemoRadiSam system protein A
MSSRAVSGEPPTAESDPVDASPGTDLGSLLELARAAVVAAVTGCPAPDPIATPSWSAPADAFVTLRRGGHLRGCVGTLGAGWPVERAIVHAAGMAALDDPRFEPVGLAELPELDLEVSVLAPPRSLEDPGTFVPGRDGVVVEARGRRGLLLPQVATEMGWGATEMLAGACQKAGLPADAWLDPATHLEVFEVLRAAGPLTPAPAPTTDGPSRVGQAWRPGRSADTSGAG